VHCSNCGSYCEPSDNFCRKCGAAFKAASPEPLLPPPSYPVPWRQLKNNALHGFVTLSAAVALEILNQALTRRGRRLAPWARLPQQLFSTRISSEGFSEHGTRELRETSQADEFSVVEGFAFRETRVRR
jgi:hypothetical protein